MIALSLRTHLAHSNSTANRQGEKSLAGEKRIDGTKRGLSSRYHFGRCFHIFIILMMMKTSPFLNDKLCHSPHLRHVFFKGPFLFRRNFLHAYEHSLEENTCASGEGAPACNY